MGAGKESSSARDDKWYHTKEPTRLQKAIEGTDGETCGWLEITNAWMFFTDRDMFISSCSMLGIPLPSEF